MEKTVEDVKGPIELAEVFLSSVWEASRSTDVGPLHRQVVTGAMSVVAAERGFLLLMPQGVEPGPVQFLAALDQERSEIRDPEYFVDHAVVKKVAAREGSFSMPDMLVDGTRGGGLRSVIGYTSQGLAGERWVLYLDRSPGQGPYREDELRSLSAFASWAFPLVERAWLARENRRLREALLEGETVPEMVMEAGRTGLPSFPELVGRSEPMLRIYEVIEKVKDSHLSVYIHGESGTGKELVARAVHFSGSRRDHPFISETCGSIPENLLESELFGHMKGSFTGADADKKGLFELADRGTIFLDEVGDMSEGMQRKLLRVLEEGEIRPIGAKESRRVDVRVISASNKDLGLLVQKGVFRSDLYYRLNVITIEVPPLRSRRDDIPILAEHFLKEIEREEGVHRRLSESALRSLSAYSWPGNVRELKNCLHRAALVRNRKVISRKELAPLLSGEGAASFLGENVVREGEHLLIRIPMKTQFNDIIDECERAVLESTLKELRWNKSRVTRVLKIPRQSLYNKIHKYGLKRVWDG